MCGGGIAKTGSGAPGWIVTKMEIVSKIEKENTKSGDRIFGSLPMFNQIFVQVRALVSAKGVGERFLVLYFLCIQQAQPRHS